MREKACQRGRRTSFLAPSVALFVVASILAMARADGSSEASDSTNTLARAPRLSASVPRLTGVDLSQITGGYRVCARRTLHACRVRAVTSFGTEVFPLTDIAAAEACDGQEARAMKQCAGAGPAYEAAHLKCLGGRGILLGSWDDPSPPARPSGDHDGSPRLTVRCKEGEAHIDLPPSL